MRQTGEPTSEAQPPFGWRGRASPFISGTRTAQETKWDDTRGLLSKIVDVLMQEPMDSLYRFWLASCVEAFLRGGRYVFICVCRCLCISFFFFTFFAL